MRKNQADLKNTISEIRNTLEGINSRSAITKWSKDPETDGWKSTHQSSRKEKGLQKYRVV